MIMQLTQTENLIMQWYFQFNNKIGAIMSASQYNNFRANIEDEKIVKDLKSAVCSLIDKGYLKLDSRNNFALTPKGFNYINNK